MRKLQRGVIVFALGLGTQAFGYSFQVRFVERVGNTDVVLANNTVDASDLGVHNIRLQMGVFDDGNGAAPAGGVLGWVGTDGGTLAVSGSASNSDERRNPGRMAPFNFSTLPNANGNPPLPGGDPFTTLTSIDATIGQQALGWFCGNDGQPLPMPNPVIYGRNEFVSVYAFSVDPNAGASSYTVTASGGFVLASGWNALTMTPPDCSDPNNPTPGSVLWVPVPIHGTSGPTGIFAQTLSVAVPGPMGGTALVLAGAMTGLRRRRLGR